MLNKLIALSISLQEQPCQSWYYTEGFVSMRSYKAMNSVRAIS